MNLWFFLMANLFLSDVKIMMLEMRNLELGYKEYSTFYAFSMLSPWKYNKRTKVSKKMPKKWNMKIKILKIWNMKFLRFFSKNQKSQIRRIMEKNLFLIKYSFKMGKCLQSFSIIRSESSSKLYFEETLILWWKRRNSDPFQEFSLYYNLYK